MTEKEIRTTLQRVCEELDRGARAIIYPSLVGAGIALSGCAPNAVPAYGVPADWRVHSERSYTDGLVPIYIAPDTVPWKKDGRSDGGAVPHPDMVYGVKDLPPKKDAQVEKVPQPDSIYGVGDIPVKKDAQVEKVPQPDIIYGVDIPVKKDTNPDTLAPTDTRPDTVAPRDGGSTEPPKTDGGLPPQG